MNNDVERLAFEQNFVKNGGSLALLKWDACDDGAGTYQPDWIAIKESGIHRDELSEYGDIMLQKAERVSICLLSWLECAASKQIPDGFILMPKQATPEMLDAGYAAPNNLESRYAAMVNKWEQKSNG